MTTWASHLAGIVVLASLTCSGGAAHAQAPDPDLAPLAEELARLRGEIELLDARLEEQRDDRRGQLRALAARKAALELELQKEKLRAQQLGERLGRDRDKKKNATARREHLEGAIVPALTRYAESVRKGIPFRIEERSAELDALRTALESGSISASEALDKVWTWVDAELALARQTGLHPQVIKLGGAEVMSEVARLGLVVLYARTPDGRFAVAQKNGETWSWSLVETPADQERVKVLFTAINQGLDKGFYSLPGALAMGGTP
jgi:hypothetical protein